MSILNEFKQFALKGNVVDLAVGIIIGGAFGNIVNSAVNDLIMPIAGRFVGNADFHNLYVPLSAKVPFGLSLEDARKLGAVWAYGNFLTVTLNFAILAFCVFLLVKAINTARQALHVEEQAAPPPGPSPDVVLLTEIRDLLKKP
ncbi:MAG: large conductance mechanosensitive channel protein MscL [Verrucomicrobium sp.]|nr:large conductance mechanosensitive channel protein MscL [Verrucomicrobium sp.]